MISSHGFIQGYNGLSLVDSKHQVVVYSEAYGTGQEGEIMKDTLEFPQKSLLNKVVYRKIY